MRLESASFVEHRSAGMQEVGTQVFENLDLVVGGACTCGTSGCCSCSSTAAVNQSAHT